MRKVQLSPSTGPLNSLTYSLVRMFLEGMAKQGEEPDNTPPRSVADPDDYVKNAESVRNDTRSPRIYSPAPRSNASNAILGTAGRTPPFGTREVEGNGRHDDIYDNDADSNVQEGVRSEMGDAMPVCNILRCRSFFILLTTFAAS